jgi:hypothetical protein
MAIHKLDLGEFDEIDYYLIAIHTSLEDYRLAFFINQLLPINLSKSTNEIQITIEEGETSFSRFYYYDNEKAITWNLIQNKNEVIRHKKGINHNLFSNVTMEVSTKVFLLPEFKKVDYFLKIENIDDTMSVSTIQTILNKIDKLSTLYTVDTSQIKSKNNLIF